MTNEKQISRAQAELLQAQAEMLKNSFREWPLWYLVKTVIQSTGKIESEIVSDDETGLPIAIKDAHKPQDDDLLQLLRGLRGGRPPGCGNEQGIGKSSKPFQSLHSPIRPLPGGFFFAESRMRCGRFCLGAPFPCKRCHQNTTPAALSRRFVALAYLPLLDWQVPWLPRGKQRRQRSVRASFFYGFSRGDRKTERKI